MDASSETTLLEEPPFGLTPGKDSLLSSVRHALELAANYSFSLAKPDGHWCGELKSNATITAEYVFLRQALGLESKNDAEALRRWFLSEQQPNGSWSIAPAYAGDISTTTEAYLALKLLGYRSDDPAMIRARDFVLGVGGVAKVRIFTRIYLATFGLFPWAAVPELPAEAILMPAWSPINIYKFSSWARSTIVPLLIVYHHQPIYPLPNGRSAENNFLDELWCNPSDKMASYSPPLWDLWRTDSFGFAFAAVDRILHYLGGLRRSPTRTYARKLCIDWILSHQEESGDWAGIFPPMHISLLALTLEGYTLDDPPVYRGLEAVERFAWRDRAGKRVQACVSPVWDTILMTIGLCDAGLRADSDILKTAVNWIQARQLLGPEGDWRVYSSQQIPGGFSFEYFNSWYPDVDDTTAAILAFLKQDSESARSSCVMQATLWVLGMQNRDGGWGAFDLDNDKLFLNKIPFSDMDSLCDPSTADVTGRIVEAFGLLLQGGDLDTKSQFTRRIEYACSRGIAYLESIQEPSGAWYGRWGSNYVYGTSNVLCGLAEAPDAATARTERMVATAIQWLKSVQNDDGGWGEELDSYKDVSRAGHGESTASQTAWALMALLAHCPYDDKAIHHGVSYLINSQISKNEHQAYWPEAQYTGTGFPNHFYLGYSLYAHYFPMMALGRYARARGCLALKDI